MFERELNFFIANQDDLVARYDGRVLVLRGEEVLGAFTTPLEAYLDATEKFETGSFAIQPCSPGPDAYTVTLSGPDVPV